ncbi:MAG: hypothetical protein F6K48_13030 [Okeania sp. SIO3H1]|nr:hypothetical protein [Okeania sp. SIO3H1]
MTIEVLLQGIAAMKKVKKSVIPLTKKMIATLGYRYPGIADAITVAWLKQLNL